jgi:signal transduction histidine kinase
MTIDYQQRYKLELAHKTLNWGKYIAFIAIVFIVLFYFGDIYDLQLKNTLPWRLLGLAGPVLYLCSRILVPLQDKVVFFYSLMMLLIIAMMSIMAAQIFIDPDATDRQLFAITTGYTTVWVLIAVIAFGGRRPISFVGGGILILTLLVSYSLGNITTGIGYILSMLMAGIIAIILMMLQARYDRERAFSVYALEDSRDTIKKQAEDLQLANDNMMTFTRAMSHDLQSPLRSVRSFLDLYEQRSKKRLPEDTQEYLDLARHYLERGQAVVSDLLTYSKIGKDPIVKSSVDLAGLSEEIVTEVTAALDDKEKFTFDYQLEDPVLAADEKLLWHVLQNLISNAIKFSQKTDSPVIIIRSNRVGTETILEIKDNGVGFDQDFSTELGKPFTRLHGSEFSGTGIGLSIVRQVMELHSGRFWAISKPGEGASFFCAFPNE